MKKSVLLFLALLCLNYASNAQTFNATVAKDGSGTHTTVAAAISSAPTNSTTTYYIRVKPGVYVEKDTVPTNRPNITLIGDNVLTTIINFNDNATTLNNGSAVGTSGSAAFFVNGASFTAGNITFQNNSGVAAGQAVAVNISGDKASFRNCRFLGFQDVLYCKNSGIASYFNNCYIEGTVDFIFGASTSWFENCYIYCKNRNTGGIVCAPNTAAGTSFGSPWGLVFNNCKINGASNMGGLYYLGRPWQNKPQAVFLNTNMSDVINAAGWSNNSAGSATGADVSFGEFNNSGVGANGGSRSSTLATILNATQAGNYTTGNVLGTWDPCTSTVSSMCNAADFPVATANFLGIQNNVSSATLSWNMCWPLAITYVVKRSVNGGAYTTINTTNGSASNYNYSVTDNALQGGVNKYILEMTFNSITSTSTDTITISNQPTITSSVSSLAAFAQTIGSPSVAYNFSISGSNMTNNITVTAPTNFQVSTNNSTWGSTASYTQTGGTVASSIVYVRLNASSNGSYSGNLVFSTTGGSNVNVAVSGTTSTAPAYTGILLQEYLLTSNGNDNSATRQTGVNAANVAFNRLNVSDNTSIITGTTTMPSYGATFGMGFGPVATGSTLSNGLWSTANNGTGGNLLRTHYVQFTVTGSSGYTLRLDSIILQSAFYGSSSNTKFAVVYSKTGFTTNDSTDIASGGLFNGAAIGTGFGSFASPVVLANQTGGPTNKYSLPFTTNTGLATGGGIALTSGQTLTVRIYFACSSSSIGRYGMMRNVQFKGSVTPPPPTITSFTPTSQIATGNVTITGTNFSNVSAVSFGGTPATSFVVNSGTQITAVVATGTTGSVSVTTVSGTATLAGFTFQSPTTYYNVPNTDVTSLSNWGTNTDGTGTNPSNFTSNLQTFRIYNPGASMSSAWIVSGTNSKISVNVNSGSFAVTDAITGIVDIEADADVQIKTANAPTFGTIANGSTVGYSGSIAQTITAANYANLTLNGTGTRTFPSSVVGVAGQFTTNSYATANSGSIISFNGNSPQTIPPFTYDSLIINNPNGCITQGGGNSVVVNKGCNVSQNLTVDAGDTWIMAGNNGISFTVAAAKTLTVSGTLDNQSSGIATWGNLASNVNSATVLGADSSRFVINSGGLYKINAPVNNSYFIGVGNYKAGSTIQVLQGSPRIPAFVGGNLIYATTSVGTGSLVQQASNTINGSFTISGGTINNGTGGTARTLTVNGDLTVTGGEYDVNGNSTGTSAAQVLNVYGNINVSGGKLYPTISANGGSGTINAYGNISITGGNFANAAGALVGNNLALLGTTTKTSTGINGNALNITMNNTAGVTFSGNVNASTLTLSNGLVNMGPNTMNVSGAVTRTVGWITGNLSRNFTTGSNVSNTYDIGDASNYLPVSITMASVTTSGNVVVSTNTPITAVANYGSSVISPVNYINRYWNLSNAGTIFTNYSATFNYMPSDIIGTATSTSVFGYLYNGSWSSQTVSGSGNSNTISNATAIGNVMFGNDCTPTTPTISITTTTTTVCSGNSVLFNSNITNGGTMPTYQWKNNGNDISGETNATYTAPAGSLLSGAIISCVLTSNKPCATSSNVASNNITLTVNPSPAIPSFTNGYTAITGNTVKYCTHGIQNAFYSTTLGGVWSSSNPSVVTINTSSTGSGGAVTTIGNGNAVISYTLSATTGTGCSSSKNVNIIVDKQATPAAISGLTSICVGSTTTYANTTGSGVWATTGRMSINGTTGFATATSGGNTTISYTTTNLNGCSASATYAVTVNALPAVPSIGYASGTINPQAGCAGGLFGKNRTFTLVGTPNTPGSGAWSSTGQITITSAGVATTSNTNGAGSVTYTYTNANGCTSSRTITSAVGNCSPKGLNNLQSNFDANLFSVYPNPAKNFINITAKNVVEKSSIIISDLLGKTVIKTNLSLGVNIIDVSSLTKGMYLVHVISSENKMTQKIIVE